MNFFERTGVGSHKREGWQTKTERNISRYYSTTIILQLRKVRFTVIVLHVIIQAA